MTAYMGYIGRAWNWSDQNECALYIGRLPSQAQIDLLIVVNYMHKNTILFNLHLQLKISIWFYCYLRVYFLSIQPHGSD